MLPCPCPGYAGLPCRPVPVPPESRPGRQQALILFDESGNPQLRNVARAITNYIKSKVDQFLHAAPIPSRLTNRDNTSPRSQIARADTGTDRKRPHRTTDSCPSRARASPKIAHQHTEKWCRGSTTQPARLSRVAGAGFIGTPILRSVFACLTRARREKDTRCQARPGHLSGAASTCNRRDGIDMLADYRRRTISCHVVGHERICL